MAEEPKTIEADRTTWVCSIAKKPSENGSSLGTAAGGHDAVRLCVSGTGTKTLSLVAQLGDPQPVEADEESGPDDEAPV